MHKPWSVPGLISGKNPPSAAAGEPPDPPLIPPDPPDPASSLSPHNFPSLSDSKTAPRSASAIRKGSYCSTVNTDKALAPQTATGSVNIDNTTMATSTGPLTGSAPQTSFPPESQNLKSQNLKTIPSKNSSPIITNKTSSTPSIPHPTDETQSPMEIQLETQSAPET